MAGRIRTIKPELLDDAIVAGLSHEAFRLFIGMLLVADDHGNLRASERWLEGQVFHGRPLGEDVTMAGLLAELGAKLVAIYHADGQRYAHINGWAKHQRIDNAMEPRIPLPPGWTCERQEKKEGARIRIRWVSTPPADVVVCGAAPRVTWGPLVPHQSTPGVLVGEPGAAGPDLDPIRPRPDREQEGAAPAAPEAGVRAPVVLSREHAAVLDAVSPFDDVCGRCGGPDGLAKLLVAAVPARRPGVDVGDIARLACLQIQGEITNGAHTRPGGLANLVRLVFTRLYVNPEQADKARGHSKFGPVNGRNVGEVGDDFAAAELAERATVERETAESRAQIERDREQSAREQRQRIARGSTPASHLGAIVIPMPAKERA